MQNIYKHADASYPFMCEVVSLEERGGGGCERWEGKEVGVGGGRGR